MSDNRQKESNINLLVIIAVDFDSSLKKGVTELLSQYDEDKFFSKVYLICPYIRRDREISLTDRVQFREYGWGRKTFGKFMSPFHFIRLIFKILNIVRLNEISLIRATEPTLAGIIALIASKLSGVPYCVSIHADYDQRFKLDGASGAPTLLGSRLLIWPIEKIVLKHAIRIFPIRESLTPYLLDRGVSLDKIRIFPHGINLDIFHKPIDFNLRSYLGGVSEETKIIVFAGRLSPENYVDEILDIALLLSKYRTDFLILLIGGGQLQEQLEIRISSNKILTKTVRMLGFIDRNTVCSIRRTCNLSICLMGGFSLIEACAGGRPVIGYDVEWHSELIINNKTGFLIEEHDINGVVDKINFILGDSNNASRMGENAKKLAFARHDIKKITLNKRQYYSELL